VASFQFVRGQNLNFAVAGESVLKLKPTGAALAISRWTFNNSLEQPKLAEELCRQGYSFSINGEDQKALQFFRQAIDKDPKNTMAWNGLGYCHVGLNNPQAAIKAYQQAIKTDPTDATLHYNLANYYIKLAYKEAIRVEPDYVSAHFNLGTALLQKGDKTGALDEYKILKKLDKETADNLFNKIYY
jgi:tetratricopeptide (TPR) repeat protein